MARVAVVVNREKLVASIRTVEKNGPMNTRSELYEKVAKEYNSNVASSNLEITSSVVMLRINEFKLTVLTPVGQRGRKAGVKMTDEQKAALAAGRKNRVPGGRKAKFQKNPEIKQALIDLQKSVPETFLPLVERIVNGSVTSAVRLMCLQCSNFQRVEVKECQMTNCALYAFRPYQTGIEDSTEEIADEESLENETSEVIEIEEEIEEAA